MDTVDERHPRDDLDLEPTFVRVFFDRAEAIAVDPAPGAARTVLVERRAKAAGAMPPLHARDVDELHYVLEGMLTFFVGDEVVTAADGEVVVVPGGLPRTYRIGSAGARWLVLTRAASPTRFEDFGLALAEPRKEWSTDDAAAVSAIAGVNGITVLGPPGMLPGELAGRG